MINFCKNRVILSITNGLRDLKDAYSKGPGAKI